MHLRAATDALRAVGGERTDELSAALTAAYASLRAAQPDPFPAINIHVRRVRRRVWVRRVVRLVILLTVVAALAWAGWAFRHELPRLIRRGSA